MHWKDNHFCWEKNTMLPYKHSSVTEHVHFYISISCFWKNNSFFSCFFFCCKTDDIIFWWTLSTITLNIFFLTKLPHFFFFCVDEEEEIYNLPRSLGSIRQWLLCTTEWFPPPCNISTYRIYSTQKQTNFGLCWGTGAVRIRNTVLRWRLQKNGLQNSKLYTWLGFIFKKIKVWL